jgi:hypothetical protein
MNVQLLPGALKEIEALRASGYRGAGFLLGTVIGRFLLVEQLLPLDFNRRSGDAVYAPLWEKYGQRLQGVFFCRKPPFASDWFIGDLVMAIRPSQIEILVCEFSAAKRRGRLVPLLENKEGKWRI